VHYFYSIKFHNLSLEFAHGWYSTAIMHLTILADDSA
jgi:hypothetical protein